MKFSSGEGHRPNALPLHFIQLRNYVAWPVNMFVQLTIMCRTMQSDNDVRDKKDPNCVKYRSCSVNPCGLGALLWAYYGI